MVNQKNIIRRYYNTVQVHFIKVGDKFTIKTLPHYSKWREAIGFLRKRGFVVTENDYIKKHFACLSKNNRIGYKKDVVCLMELNGDGFSVNFGHVKNLWKDQPQSFWDNPRDDRYTQLSYMENCAVNLEILRFMEFCTKKYKLELQINDDNLSPEQYIIHKLQVNTHIHGKVTSLIDIKNSIKEDSYDWLYNSNDRNKKKIICGQVKYFYSWRNGQRLSCGIVWHNINNMWWVIAGNQLHNIAAFDLFDYSPELPRRKPTTDDKINKLLSRFASDRQYLRCNSIKLYAENKLKIAV